ncbi:hypothetical protein [Parabacteroides distasonis]|uniref:hypothetical protein n=1 Tax=Parabacteroides distasonis TaxID=823 RepID=UPI0039B5B2B2
MRQFLRSIEFEYSEQSRQFFREAFCGLLGILLILSPYVGYGQDIVGPDNPLPGKVVVSVDGTGYGSLKEAFNAVSDGGTIKLEAACLLDEQIGPLAKTVTLDLNGHTLTGEGPKAAISLNKLLLKNGAMAGDIKLGTTYADASVRLDNLSVMVTGAGLGYRGYRVLVNLTPEGVTDVVSPSGSFQYQGESYDAVYDESPQLRTACLWLPQNILTAPLTFSGSNGKNYTTIERLAVTVHADSPVAIREQSASEVTYEAELDGTKYETFQKALDKVTGNQIIKLLASVSYGGSYMVDKDLTIDLNGCALTRQTGAGLAVGGLTVDKDKTLTFKGEGILGISVFMNGMLVCPSSVRMTGQVMRDGEGIWRTLVKGFGGTPASLTYKGNPVPYSVIDNSSLWAWLPSSGTSQEIKLTVESKIYTVSATAQTHDNRVTLKEVVAPDNIASATVGTNVTLYPTLEEAFSVPNVTKVTLLKDQSFRGTTPVSGKVTLDLAGHTLTCEGATLNAGNGSLVVLSSVGSGKLAGSFNLSGLIYAEGSNWELGTAMRGGNTVYRTMVTMPVTYTGGQASFTLGASTYTALVRNNIACLWLPATVGDERLSYTHTDGKLYAANVWIKAHSATPQTLSRVKVAEIGTTGYGTLTEAFAALTEGATVNLLSSLTLSETLEVPIAVTSATLNLDGYSLTAATGAGFRTSPAGTLVLMNGHINGNFLIDGNLYAGPDISLVGLASREGAGVNRVLVENLPADAKSYSYNGRLEQSLGYVRDSRACLWITAQPVERDFVVSTFSGTDYTVNNITIASHHGNVIRVGEPNNETRIGDTQYSTFAKGLEAVKEGETLVLLKDITLGSSPAEKNVSFTIDLNGHHILSSSGVQVSIPNGCVVNVSGGDGKTGSVALNFDFKGSGCVLALGDVIMTGIVISDGNPTRTVYRTLVTLPGTSDGGIYSYNGAQGDLYAHTSCLWLASTPGVASDFVVSTSGQNYTVPDVSIASNHSNLILVGDVNGVASVANVAYNTLEAALAEATRLGNRTPITLLRDVTLQGNTWLSTDILLDLNGHNLIATAGTGFSMREESIFIIEDNSAGKYKGGLYGDCILSGPVFVAGAVSVNGTVKSQSGMPLLRTQVTGLNSATNRYDISSMTLKENVDFYAAVYGSEATLWMPTMDWEEELSLSHSSMTYAVTNPKDAHLHNRVLRAYPCMVVDTDKTLDHMNLNRLTDLVIRGGATVTIDGNVTGIRRLILEDGCQVLTNEQVFAMEGIRFVRTFKSLRDVESPRWEGFSLPFEPLMAYVITEDADGKKQIRTITPASSMTGGDYWLQELDTEGRFHYPDEPRIYPNRGYIIAMPSGKEIGNERESLTDKPVTFVAGGIQLLQREETVPDEPESGFKLCANPTLHDFLLTGICYTLDEKGKTYERRMDGAMIPPTGSYILAEREWALQYRSLRVDNGATGIEIVTGDQKSRPMIYGARGMAVIESVEPVEVWVYRADGRLVLRERIPSGTSRLPLPAGYYLVNGVRIVVR